MNLSMVPREVWYALVLLLAGWLAYDWAHDRGAASRDAEVDALQARVSTLEGAAKDNLATIASLEAANESWATMATSNEAAAKRAAARLETERVRHAGEMAAERAKRAKIYQGDSNAQSWAAAAVPTAIADRVRDAGTYRSD